MKKFLISSIFTISIILFTLTSIYFVSIQQWDGQYIIYITMAALILGIGSMVSASIVEVKMAD